MQKKELSVSAIENGTVIDHITQGVVLQVIKILGLEECTDNIYIGANLDSKKYGKKGLVKVSNHFFHKDDFNKIALLSPNATFIEIKDFEVVKKTKVSIPAEVKGMIKCVNPNCITNHQEIETRFTVVQEPELKLKCHYCEKYTIKSSMVFV